MVNAISMQFVILRPCRRIMLKTCTQYQCIAQKTQIRNQLPNVEYNCNLLFIQLKFVASHVSHCGSPSANNSQSEASSCYIP